MMKKPAILAAALVAASLTAPAFANHDGTGPDDGKAMMPSGLVLPMMDPAKGRKLFASKGCVVCHSINGVGGTDAPALDADTMDMPMDPFDFSAKMWRGAPAMIAMQEDELGAQIEFTGDELADIIAFAHSPEEQAKFTKDDIPKEVMAHMMEDQ